MSKAKSYTPEGLRNVTLQLVVKNGPGAIEFLKKAFGAEMPFPPMMSRDGKSIMHAHFKIGDSTIFLSESGGFAKETTANIFMYVPDVDKTVQQAIAAGGKLVAPVIDQFWGDRWGMLEDPFGNVWQVATRVEDVSPEEMQRRMANLPPLTAKGPKMRYLLLIQKNEAAWRALSDEGRAKLRARYSEYGNGLIERGICRSGAILEPIETATTVRVRDGKRLVTDGPFAETAEQIAGICVIEVADLDEALRVAAEHPDAEWGSVEVRPVQWDLPDPS